MVFRRTASAPTLLTMLVDDGRHVAIEDDSDDDGHRRMNSNGAGEASPTAWATLARMWYGTLNRDLTVHPRLVVQDMGNRIFVGVYLWPAERFIDGQPLAAVHRDRWHSSLATAYWGAELMWRTIDPQTVVRAWRRAVVTMQVTESLTQSWDTTVYGLADDIITKWPSPFYGKWMFAVNPMSRLGMSLVLMQLIAGHVFSTRFGREVNLRRRREIHVSWN